MKARNEEEVRRRLREACVRRREGREARAVANGFGRSFVHDVLKGSRRPSPKLAEKLGFRLAFVRRRKKTGWEGVNYGDAEIRFVN